jgi:hypothetical protein
MSGLDRVGPTLPSNPLRRVEDRKRERQERRPAPSPPPPDRPRRDDDDDRPHLIDELA